MPSTNPTIIQEHFKSLHLDAIIWKSQRLWDNASDPDDQALAMDQLVDMICCIRNETKQQQYIELVQRTLKIKNQLLKKSVKEKLTTQEAKRQAEIAKKKLESQFSSAEEAGLPENFRGNFYDALKYGIYEHEGVYYTRGNRGADYPISNFTMKILYHVDTSDEQAFRLIAVKNVYGFESFINMNTDDFVSLGPFKKILARRGDYVFKGTDADLSRLQELLQKDEVKTVYIKTLGWHKRGKFYAWGNGIFPIEKDENGQREFLPVDEYGIVHYESKNFFIPAVSKMYAEKDDLFVNEKKFVYKPPIDGINFGTWSQLFYRTYGDKSIAAILFFIGSLFRDVIMKQIQRYPILNLFGPPGAGKGQIAESLLSLFGEKQDQIMLGGASTVVGFMRKFAQFANAIVWLDEYKNDLPLKFIESFKNIYDGKGYERGKMTNDFSTESTPIHSSCILSGQHMPTQEPALFMRVIMLSFEDGKFTPDQRLSLPKLKDLESEGLSFITAELLQHRQHIQNRFKEQSQNIFKQLVKDVNNNEVDDRMILNVSILLTVHYLLKDQLQFPFKYDHAKKWMIENMMTQHAILAGNNDIAKFWEVVQSLFTMDLIKEDRDFMLADGYLFIQLQQIFPLYMKELRQRGDVNVLTKPTLRHYLMLDKTKFISETKKRFKEGINTWCMQFRYDKLGIDLIKVVKKAFESEEQHTLAIKQKYEAMGLESPIENGFKTQEEDLPFPIEK